VNNGLASAMDFFWCASGPDAVTLQMKQNEHFPKFFAALHLCAFALK
jgi:hypothetical protein